MSIDITQYSASTNDTEKLKKLYEKNGFVLIREAIPMGGLDELIDVIDTLLSHRLAQLEIKTVKGNIDAKLEQLVTFGQDKVECLLRAIRESLPFHSMLQCPELQSLLNVVTKIELPHLIFETCMLRIDRQVSSSRDFAWHFDAAYTAQPLQAVVFWIPLTPVDSQMGPLRLVPGSHKWLHNVRFHRELANTKLSGPKRVELVEVDFERLESLAIDVHGINPGDVILLHGWTLHRSGKNSSNRARWVFNPRFSDLLDEKVLENDWRVSRPGDPWVFQEYYPDLIKD